MPVGATSDETEIVLGLTHQSCSPRYTELRGDHYIKYLRDDDKHIVERKTSRGKRGACVHVATAKGLKAAERGWPIAINRGDPTRHYHGGDPRSDKAFRNSNDRAGMRLDVLRHVVAMTPQTKKVD